MIECSSHREGQWCLPSFSAFMCSLCTYLGIWLFSSGGQAEWWCKWGSDRERVLVRGEYSPAADHNALLVKAGQQVELGRGRG